MDGEMLAPAREEVLNLSLGAPFGVRTNLRSCRIALPSISGGVYLCRWWEFQRDSLGSVFLRACDQAGV